MSWRVTLDHVRRGNGYDVPRGSMDEAVRKYAWERPLKLYFKDRAVLKDWWDACVREFGVWDPNGPTALFQLKPDGTLYEDVTGDGPLTAKDYGSVDGAELETRPQDGD